MVNEKKDERLKELLRHTAAEFFAIESNYTSLLTVTDVRIGDRGTRATIYFTVFPSDKEKGALDFAKRKRAEFRSYFADHSRIQRLPFIDFEIDLGEKNRQKIDELSQQA
jgi:ribosome-binding factor A